MPSSLFKWNGTTYQNAPSATTVTYGYDATGATIRVGIQDLGGTKAINFGADAISGITTDASGNPDFTNAHDDLAPDRGSRLLQLQRDHQADVEADGVRLHAEAGEVGCTRDRDAGRYRERHLRPGRERDRDVRRDDQGRRLRATHSLAGGVASCFWKVPKTAKGKTLLGKITITLKGTTLAHAFTTKIHLGSGAPPGAAPHSPISARLVNGAAAERAGEGRTGETEDAVRCSRAGDGDRALETRGGPSS